MPGSGGLRSSREAEEAFPRTESDGRGKPWRVPTAMRMRVVSRESNGQHQPVDGLVLRVSRPSAKGEQEVCEVGPLLLSLIGSRVRRTSGLHFGNTPKTSRHWSEIQSVDEWVAPKKAGTDGRALQPNRKE